MGYYVGFGGYGHIKLDEPASYAMGIRMPLALNLWPLNNDLLELFFELAPAWIPLTSSGLTPVKFEGQAAIGFRIWTQNQ